MTLFTQEILDGYVINIVEFLKNPRTLVFVARALPGRAFTFTIDASHDVEQLKRYAEVMMLRSIQESPTIFGLLVTSPHSLQLFSTQQASGGWGHRDKHDRIQGNDHPQSTAPLLNRQTVTHYFPADIPAVDTGVVHFVVELSTE